MAECCKWCGSIDLRETIMSHGPHYSRLDCKDCGKFVKWGKKPARSEPTEVGDTKENKHTGGVGMNKVFLVGRLTRDPELRYTSSSNIPVCTFTLAVDRRFKQENGPQADFIPVIAWRSTAEFCSKYFAKGRKVIVAGRIETRSWDDEGGKKHYVTEVIADEVDFADSKKDDSNLSVPPPEPPPESKSSVRQSTTPPPQANEKRPWEE